MISIFEENETDDENENVQNIETLVSEQRMTELMKNEFISFIRSENPENQNNQTISINQTVRISRARNIPDQSTRRSTRLIKPYNRYEYDNQKGLIAMNITDFSTQRPEPSTYQKAITCQNQRLWKNVISEQLNAFIANQT